MSSPRILIIEHSQPAAAEVSSVAAELAQAGIACERQAGIASERTADFAQAIAHLTSEAAPQLVLLAESRPGLWSDRELDALRGAAPLVRMVRISGCWCEGQNRSGRPPAGSLSVSWHQVKARLLRGLVEHDGSPWLTAPLTATNEDLLLASKPAGAERVRDATIAIHAPRVAQAEAWAELCRGLGYRAIRYRPLNDPPLNDGTCSGGAGETGDGDTNDGKTSNAVPATANHSPRTSRGDTAEKGATQGQSQEARGAVLWACDAVLWDCDPRDLADGPHVRGFVERAGVPVIVVSGFPRPDDVESALRQGVSAVLAKPLARADFEWLFSRLFGSDG